MDLNNKQMRTTSKYPATNISGTNKTVGTIGNHGIILINFYQNIFKEREYLLDTYCFKIWIQDVH